MVCIRVAAAAPAAAAAAASDAASVHQMHTAALWTATQHNLGCCFAAER
jgi:hypothetical protein